MENAMVPGAELSVSGTADLSRPMHAKRKHRECRGGRWETLNNCWFVKRVMVGKSNSIEARSTSNVASKHCAGVSPCGSCT